MATKKEEVTTPVETPVITPEPVQTVAAAEKKPTNPLWWVLGTALGILVILLLASAIKNALDYSHAVRTTSADRDYRGGYNDRFEGGMGRGGMMMTGQGATNSSTRITGVVTTVDGTKLTVAGNGTTKTVETNDSTQYYGAAQPVKVNDSVMVYGTTANDVFTATRITIQRQ